MKKEKIHLALGERGVERVTVIAPGGKDSVRAMALYAKLEDAIEQFKSEVRKALSASCGGRK